MLVVDPSAPVIETSFFFLFLRLIKSFLSLWKNLLRPNFEIIGDSSITVNVHFRQMRCI